MLQLPYVMIDESELLIDMSLTCKQGPERIYLQAPDRGLLVQSMLIEQHVDECSHVAD